MTNEELSPSMIENEPTVERIGQYIGRLGGFGLGNPEGIPSRWADKTDTELGEKAQELSLELRAITDPHHWGCIDGRCVLRNADGSTPEVRLRHVSGTGSALGIALSSGATIEGVSMGTPLVDSINKMDEYLQDMLEVNPSAHTAGCGGLNGEVPDLEAIATNSAVLDVAQALMSLPVIQEELDLRISDDEFATHKNVIRTNAVSAMEYFTAQGWDGANVVENTKKKNPAGVAELQDDPNHQFHGHKEDAIVIVLGEKTLDIDNLFVINLEAIIAQAAAIAKSDNALYARAIMAGLAKHLATADRLPSTETPVFVIGERATV